MIKIILAEDHNIVRKGIRNLLESVDNIEVVGEALNGKEVLALIQQGAAPDMILADMNMPEMGGIELAAELKSTAPKVKTLLLTMMDHEKYVVKAFNSGALGYLLKNVSSDELIFAIKHVCKGERYICSELALRFLDRLIQVPESSYTESQTDIEFSKRETEVLHLIAEGYTNQEIADQLFTSKRTVEGHRQSMIDKTGTRNTAALIKFALQNGIIS